MRGDDERGLPNPPRERAREPAELHFRKLERGEPLASSAKRARTLQRGRSNAEG